MKSKRLLLTLLLALFVPWAAMAQNLCDPADMCEISYSFTDSWGDGWNGNYIEVVDVSTSTVLATWTLNSGASGSGTLPVCTNRQIRFDYTVGEGDTYPSENSWVIYDFAGNVIWEYSSPYTSMSQTYNVVCPSCPLPTLSQNVTVGSTTATLTWVENGEADAWVLQYGTNSDFTAGTFVEVSSGFTVEGTTITANINGLTGEQTYYARVRAACNTETEWSITASFTPTAAITATIYQNATDHCDYVPVYGYYADNKQQSEFIIPASQLSNLADGTIKAMTFYAGYNFNSTASFQVYLKEVEDETISQSTFYGTEGATTVYTGKVSISSTNGMTITFTNNYTYNGGNLLVGFYLPSGGNCSSSGDYFIGKTVSGASHSSTFGSTPTQRNFIPTTTFLYLPNPTPKPKNLQVSNLAPTSATLSWEAPTTATPTGYEYQYKKSSVTDWPATWQNNFEYLNVALSLDPYTDYDFRVRANYAEGNSEPVETSFKTLASCAIPTNFVATTTPGQGNKATLTWVRGYDEEAWVLEYGTDPEFGAGTYTAVTDGFIINGNNVTCNLTTLTPETHYYARVQSDCGGDVYSQFCFTDFTPTYYVDFPYNANATYTASYTPFYGGYAAYGTHSRFIIPSTSLADLAGGTVKKLTFYSSATTADWGDATFKVYVAEVEASSFTSNPSTSTPFDWSDMTEVYSGSLSLANGEMVILLDEPFVYSGTKNLMIGFEETNKGTNATAAWYYKSGVSNSCAYAYKTYASATNFNTSRGGYSPKMTFNYRPTPYVKIAAINEGTIAATSAELTWTAPETTATITGYAYQYKLSSAAEWPTAWSNLAASATSVTLQPLTPGTSYDFQIKVLYGEHESAVNSTSFFTECAIVTAFPWKEDFEAYAAGDFNHPCWVNQHLSGNGSYLYSVVTESMGDNDTKILKLTDQTAGTETMLRLPEMILPSNDYQFVIDVYRNTNTYQSYPYELEGIHVYVSTNGNLEGATELAYIPRHKDVSNTLIPAEEETGWYTYEIPVGISGNCYIILKGVNQYCTSIYMDNFSVEQIPSCARPKDLDYDDVTNHSATLSWTAGDAEQTLWQIAYSKTSFDPNTASFDVTTVNTVDATANPFTLDKILDAESTYYVYVRANCGTATEPDYGPWSRKGINLTTLGATPAPSNFTASNIGSQTADLVWTAGGGDYELSWDLYYLQSDDAPEPPTATTDATKTVTTLPTTEVPFELDGLTEESRYYIWVRANHTINSVTTHSAWVALTGNYFTTLAACPTPTGLAYNNLTAVSADLTWVGSPDVDDYTVQYRTAAQIDPDNIAYQEHFTSQSLPNGWTRYSTLLTDDVLNGTTALTSTSSGWGSTTYALGEYNWKVNLYKSTYGGNCQYWMVTPSIAVGANNVLTFDVALTKYNSNDAPTTYPGTSSKFFVLISSDEMATWTVLREWNNTGSNYVLNNIPNDGETISINLSAYNEKDVYIAFYGEQTESGTDNDLHIDDVVVAGSIPAGQWVTATDNVTTQSYRLNNLTGGIKYDAHVKSNCTSGEYCPEVSFTTLPAGTKVFVTAGEWGTATNWMPNGAPVITDEVILRANATIESGCVAEAKSINGTGTGANAYTLTIKDGGKLKHLNSNVRATVEKEIRPYSTNYSAENNNSDYYLIANPLTSSVTPSEANGLLVNNYDLYNWNYSASDDNEWRNYEASSFTLSSGAYGYLYANDNGTTLTYTGTINAYTSSKSRYCSIASNPENYDFPGWYLLGNPYLYDAYLATAGTNGNALPYIKMNTDGDGFENVAAGTPIEPMEGFFYQQATSSGDVYVVTSAPTVQSNAKLNMNLRSANKQLDNAILVFGGDQQLGKMTFRANSSKVYMPVEGKDYAITSVEGQVGEVPVNFVPEKNGNYSLSFTSEEVTFSYLHLIDNMTGEDVDLLANPSYSFDARTTDYESRFRLVFATGSSVDGDNFAFINGAGNLSIFGIEGEATLQVMDINGRILSTETFSGSYEKKINGAAGIYMVRLINGNDVKVQKIVVR